MKIEKIRRAAIRRKKHVRKKVFGDPERPRLSVFRSSRNIYAQVIDDIAGATLASASTVSKKLENGGSVKAAEKVGEIVAKQALDMGIKCVRFDKNRYKFHGRVKALADAARKAGL